MRQNPSAKNKKELPMAYQVPSEAAMRQNPSAKNKLVTCRFGMMSRPQRGEVILEFSSPRSGGVILARSFKAG